MGETAAASVLAVFIIVERSGPTPQESAGPTAFVQRFFEAIQTVVQYVGGAEPMRGGRSGQA